MRYGDKKTIHSSDFVDVEVDPKGQVVSVWFRCLALPFKASKVDKNRAKSMQYMTSKIDYRLKAVVIEKEDD